ncbi:MAG: chemotaxis protein CheW [Prochloraceae cyanobacterium]|nr:chemotaxis protein CheW [Prochloraceae cyanobacterium]
MVGNPDLLAGNGQGISPEIEGLQTPVGELYLRFNVPSGDEFAISAAGIREVMHQGSERITPIPNASPLLLGTINLRGQIIWVADLGQFLGDPEILSTERQEIPVIAIEDQETLLGLAIEKLGAMQWLDPERLQPPNNIPDNMAAFVQGEWILDEELNKSLRLLDQYAILRSARWAM